MSTSACIKEVDRSALVAFAPDAPFFAAGTMAGAVDMSFSSSANLELFKLDFHSDDRDLPFSGAIPSSEPFNRLSWGKSPSSGSEEFSLGLIAGGLVDGNIGVWNPSFLMSSEGSESALVQQLSRHKGPVRGLEFSSLSPNHLASGAEEGEICIWDLAKPTEPTHFPPLKGSESLTHGEISFLSWNKKVQPILASTSFHGTTVVWDLRRQKPIISFSDSVRRRCSVLQWHPDFATQLIVTFDDDNSPFLREYIVEELSSTKENDLQDGIADNSFDDAIQRMLVVGDYKGAVAQCIAANMMADALVIAQVGGSSLWETTRDHYLKHNTSPYLKVIAAMVNSDLVSLVNIRPLKSWKETLAFLCTFAQGDDWTLLCDNLDSRLVTAGNSLAATLCYICSGNIGKTVEIWSKKVTVDHEGKSYVDLLQELMEKTMVLALATGQKKFSASFCKLVEKYAEILASQGRLSTAMEYLKLIGTDDLSLELSILRDWIALSFEPETTATESADYGYSQTHTGDAYQQMNSVVEPRQNYQENYHHQQQPPSPGPCYTNHYEPPQRSMFVPSPAVPNPTLGFNQPPITTQTATRPFVPVTPPIMRDADQYQQLHTLGSQLYPEIVSHGLNP
ncbi:hypothetical protein L1987_01069 [Smallanthus sonchifolius]|uniref:Uncharacterized protein n=1 Tax=Smallanthus sonchifolius TaxID=185202 RepID=A0ACB9K406_9ASTR|nr:hypothetical protein L1987_01069 [Smallanthus sonchifolius]